MDNNLKKKLYLFMLTSILLVGCGEKKEEVVDENISSIGTDTSNSTNNDVDDIINSELLSEIIEDNNIESEMNSTDEIKLVLPKEDFKSEEEVVSYFKKLKDDVEVLLTLDSNEEDKIDSRVMTFVEYMIEDKEIGGYLFNELNEDSKIAIKTLYMEMDTMIENKKPNYKEKLIDKSKAFKDYCVYSYNIIKEQVIKWYNDGTLKENIYEGIFGGLDEDFDNAKETFKELLKRAKTNLRGKK